MPETGRACWGLFAAICGALTGCIHPPPAAQAPQPTPVLIGYAFDHIFDRGEDPPPEALVTQIDQAMVSRNLPPDGTPFEKTREVFSLVRDTEHRYTRLEAMDRQPPLILLVETNARFLTADEGKYSWRVYVKLTAGWRGARERPETESFDLPASLQFDHEKEREAVASVAATIADRAANMMDVLLQLPPTEPEARAPAPALAPRAGSIYFVMVDRYADGDPTNDQGVDKADPAAFHGGDIAGVLQHLDDIQALGVKTVWLSPVFESRSEKFFGHGAFHGYWVDDLTRMDPRFGAMAKLRQLSDELHRRRMGLLLDMVLNHVAFDAPLTRTHPEWFHDLGDIKDWNDPRQVEQGNVMGLPDLAQEQPEVARYLIDTSERWIDAAQPDGFRLDAVRHVPLDFWATYNEAMRRHAGGPFFLLGEMLDGNPGVLARTERQGRFDSLFDFPLYYAMTDVFCGSAPASRLAAVLSLDREYPNPDGLVTMLDNHDLPRVMTSCHGDMARVREALSFQLTARGIPAISYGTESGLTGEKEPANRGDMDFAHRPLEPDIQRLLALRDLHPSLQRGRTDFLQVDSGFLAYARVVPSEAALILVNTGDTAVHPELVDGPEALASPRNTEVPPHQIRILFTRPGKPNGFQPWATHLAQRQGPPAAERPVDFVVRGAPPGSPLYIVGSPPELGSWDPQRGLGPVPPSGLTRSLPVNSVYEYKWVLRKPGHSPDWEPGGNHVLWLKEGTGAVRAELAWRQ